MTELMVIETGEAIEQMTPVEAERITARIADKLDAIADNLEQVLPLIAEALTRKAWESLGYTSPGVYIEERFSTALHRLPVLVRRPVVSVLSESGMSTREIAPVVNIGQTQVRRDISQVSPNGSPEDDQAAEVTKIITDSNFPKADKTTGADGKTYKRSQAMDHIKGHRTARTPLYITARNAGMDLRKSVERITNVMEDDRLTKNKEQVAELISVYLSQAVEVCQDALDQLS